jgi:hypothetical protein
VTEFEPEAMGIGGGIIGLGTLIGSAALHASNRNVPIGAATYKESHIAIDLRLVDAATSRVLFTTSVEAKGIDWGGGVIGEVGGGRSRLPLAFGGFQKTATEKAVRKAIDLAVAELARRTPAEYFRHRADEFASGRMAAFAYLDFEGLSAGLRAPGAAGRDECRGWASLAASSASRASHETRRHQSARRGGLRQVRTDQEIGLRGESRGSPTESG